MVSSSAMQLDIKVNGRDVENQIHKVTGVATKNMEKSFSSSFGRIGKMAVTAFSSSAIDSFKKSCLDLGNTLMNVESITNGSFSNMNEQINQMSNNVAGGLDTAMTKVTKDAYALENGFSQSAQGLTEQEKAMSKYQAVHEQVQSSVSKFMGIQDAWASKTGVLTSGWQTLKDTLGGEFSAAFTPISEGVGVVTSGIDNLKGSFANVIGFLSGSMPDAGSSFGSMVEEISGLVVSNIESIKSGIESFKGKITQIIQVGQAISNWGFTSTIKGLAGVHFPMLTQAISVLLSPIGAVVLALAAFSAGFLYLYSTSESFRILIDEMFQTILLHVTEVIAGLITIIDTLWTLGVQPVLDSIANGFTELWNNGLALFIENVSIFVFYIIELILGIWINAINPLIELLLNFFLPIVTSVFEGIISIAVPIITKIMEYFNLFMEIVNIVMELLVVTVLPIFMTVFNGISQAVQSFMEFAKPVFEWFTNIMGEIVSFALDFFLMPLDVAFQTIVAVIQDIEAPIKRVFEGVQNIFQGIIDFVAGVFTGNWAQAWEGVKGIFSGMWNMLSGIVGGVWDTILSLFSNGGQIFSGVVDGIASAFKSIVNSIIDGMNKVIAVPFDAINGTLNTIRNIDIPIVGQPFKGLWGQNPLPVLQIPRLAQGGYVRANTPQLAMIGDNRHQGEVVAPEDKLYEISRKAIEDTLSSAKGAGNTEMLKYYLEMIKLLQELVKTVQSKDLNIGDKQIAEANRRGEKRLGYNLGF